MRWTVQVARMFARGSVDQLGSAGNKMDVTMFAVMRVRNSRFFAANVRLIYDWLLMVTDEKLIA